MDSTSDLIVLHCCVEIGLWWLPILCWLKSVRMSMSVDERVGMSVIWNWRRVSLALFCFFVFFSECHSCILDFITEYLSIFPKKTKQVFTLYHRAIQDEHLCEESWLPALSGCQKVFALIQEQLWPAMLVAIVMLYVHWLRGWWLGCQPA